MSAFDDLPKLKRAVESLERDAAKAAGAEEQWMKQARREFGCKTLEQVIQKLKDVEERERQSDRDYGRKYKRFRRRFKKYLRRINHDDD